jgi:dipeptidase
MAEAHRILGEADKLAADLLDMKADPQVVIDSANEELAAMLKRETSDVLGKVLIEASNKMKNSYARSDA